MSDLITRDNVWILDEEAEELAAMLRGGSPRVDYRQRFLELARAIAGWQGAPLATVAARYGLTEDGGADGNDD